jgi:hypothetical protein
MLTKEALPQAKSIFDRRVEASQKVRFAFSKQSVRESQRKILESFRIDMANDKEGRFDFADPLFSMPQDLGGCGGFKALRETCRKLGTREAAGASMFAALFKTGLNNVANDWYQLTQTVYEQIVAVTPSTHAVEPYAPMARGSTPRRTPRGTQFKNTRLPAPVDIQLINEKFGAISSVYKEEIDDDQTGQIMQRLQDIGPNMALLEEAWVMAKFISTSGGTTYQGDPIPASVTKPSNETSATWPWSTSMLGGGRNIPSSYTVFSNNLVQQADYYLSIQKDQNGNFMALAPDTLLHGPGVKFVALELMNSTWYPTTAAQLIGGGAVGATATNMGTTFANNVMKGLYKPVMSRFLPSGAWAVGVAHRGMTFQMREGLSVVQENPMAEVSFEWDEMRFRSKARWMTDWIEPRFWFLGNDGTAT